MNFLFVALLSLAVQQPEVPARLLRKAKEALDSGRPEETIQILSSRLERETSPSPAELPGEAASRVAAEPEDFIADFDRVLEIEDSRGSLAGVSVPSDRLGGAGRPLSSAYLLRGAAFQMLGRSEEAARDFQRLIELEPGHVAARLNLGRLRLRQARLEEAREQLQEVLALDGGNSKAHHLLGVVSLDLSRARAASREQDLQRARQLLGRALALQPGSAQTVGLLTTVLDELGLFAESRQLFQRTLRQWRDQPELRRELAQVYLKIKNLSRAAEAFETLAGEGKDDAFLLFSLGYCYTETRQYETARRYLEQALVLSPSNSFGRFLLGSVLVKLGEGGEALQALERAGEDPRMRPRAHNELARLLASRGQVEAAINHCRQAIELRPDLAEPYYQLGLLLAQTGKGEESARHLKRFSELSRLEEEVRRRESRLIHFSEDVETHLELARLYRQQGRADKAFETLQRAARISPGRVAIALALSELLLQEGMLQEALQFCRQALEKDPDDPAALFQLAVIRLAEGNLDQAEKALRRVLVREPEHPRALNDLATLLERTARPEEAIVIFEKAVAADPESALPRNGLGVVYFKRGELDKAIASFEIAVRLDPGYDQAHLNLAVAYQQAGREAEAAVQMREYKRLEQVKTRP